jgi:hypothetical protein
MIIIIIPSMYLLASPSLLPASPSPTRCCLYSGAHCVSRFTLLSLWSRRKQCRNGGGNRWPSQTRARSVYSFPDADVVYLINWFSFCDNIFPIGIRLEFDQINALCLDNMDKLNLSTLSILCHLWSFAKNCESLWFYIRDDCQCKHLGCDLSVN